VPAGCNRAGRPEALDGCLSGPSMQKINQVTIKSLLFALPPLEEQQLIANVIHSQITINVELSMDAMTSFLMSAL